MNIFKPLLLAAALGATALVATEAQAARVVIGVGVSVPFGYGYGWGPGYYGPGYWDGYPRTVVVPQAVYVAPSAAPARTAAPDPIFYPRNGQDAALTESDRRACNAWAASQPSAMADASVFQRATFACMEGRGYTVR